MFPDHITAQDLRKELPKKVYDTFYKFAFVRNPWDWQVSLYHYMLQEPSHFHHELIKQMQNFDDYIEWRVTEDKRLQKDFVVDDKEHFIVDFVGKYEHLSRDFSHVCKTLDLKACLPHINKSLHRDYRSYYSKRTIKIVEEHFKEDIALFKYTFDNSKG